MVPFQSSAGYRAYRRLRTLGVAICAAAALACSPAAGGGPPRDRASEADSARLVIVPASVTAEIGDTVRFQALRITPSDTLNTQGALWRSANRQIATIDSTGLAVVRAPGLAGISAIHGSVVASARLIAVPRGAPRSASVASSRNPAPAPSVVPAAPTSSEVSSRRSRDDRLKNEPRGYTLITDRLFNSKVPFVRRGSYPTEAEVALGEGWNDVESRYNRFSIELDATAPSGNGRVGQMLYPAGMRSGVGPATAYVYMPEGTKEVYISFWMKLSPNWSGNQASVNKMFFFGVSRGNNQFVFVAYGSYSNALQGRIHLQGMFDDDAHGSAHRPNLGAASVVRRGQWQQFEFVLKCNSAPGVPDGSIEMWTDGVKVFEEFNTNWTLKSAPARACSMSVFNWNPTFGGGGKAVPHDQWQRVDRVYISGR